MAAKYIARPAGFPIYPEPWNPSSVTQATLFFRLKEVENEKKKAARDAKQKE